METRPTKEAIDSIFLSVRRMYRRTIKLHEEQKKTNELLEKILEILKEEQKYRKITK